MSKEKELNLLDAEGFAELLFRRDNRKEFRGYYGLGTVVNVSEGKVYTTLDSSPGNVSKGRRRLSNYSPRKGDRVLIVNDIVVGKIV